MLNIRMRPYYRVFLEYVELIGVALILYFLISTSVVKAYQIPSGSMENTLIVGDFLLVNKFVFGAPLVFTDYRLPKIRDPKVGEVIVFRYPENESIDYIKRCIALPGQTVEIRNKVLYIDNKLFPEPPGVKFSEHYFSPTYLEPGIFPSSSGNRDNYGPVKVPEGHIFVMGDNRDTSYDSRYWGFLPIENLIGKPIIIYWSWNNELPFWQIFSKVRWERIGNIIK